MRFIATTALALSLGSMAVPTASAQTPNPGIPPAVQVSPMPVPAPSRVNQATDQQLMDEINARIALLKASLRLTPEQNAQWPALEGALRDVRFKQAKDGQAMQAKRMAERETMREAMQRWRAERDRGDGAAKRPTMPQSGTSDIEMMRTQADRMMVRGDALRRIADAATPLYGTLDEGQRRRLMEGIRRGGERGAMEESGRGDKRWRERFENWRQR